LKGLNEKMDKLIRLLTEFDEIEEDESDDEEFVIEDKEESDEE